MNLAALRGVAMRELSFKTGPHLSFDQHRMTAILPPPIAGLVRIVTEVERRLSVVEKREAVCQPTASAPSGSVNRFYSGRLTENK